MSAASVSPSQTDLALVAASQRMATLSKLLERFEAASCSVHEELRACRITFPAIESEGFPHLDLLQEIKGFSDLSLRFEQSPVSFELAGSSLQALNIRNLDGDPANAFEGQELTAARQAWLGDSGAALALAGTWSGELVIDLAAGWRQIDPTHAWRAVRTVDVLLRGWAPYPWWRTDELIKDGDLPVVVVILDQTDVELRTQGLSVISGSRIRVGDLPTSNLAAKRNQVIVSSAAQVPNRLPLPDELEPNPGAIAPPELISALRLRSEACSWAWLSNSTRIGQDGTSAELEFFGYRRRTFHQDAGGYTADAGQRALRMYAWATQEASPDRILALRQVISLHDGTELPSRPEDIVRAAEPLYQALRAGEVAAVLDTQRQVRSIAVEAARHSADGAQLAAKSATDRVIASFAAVASIAVAQATAVLSRDDAAAISVGIAILFAFLALWAFTMEGPAIGAPLESFKIDLPLLGQLLPAADRQAILDMKALSEASEATKRVRIVAPIAYLVGALVTLVVAHYRFDLHF